MALFDNTINIPTDTAYQETFNENVATLIGYILSAALNQTQIDQRIADNVNRTPSQVAFGDTPYEIQSTDKFIEVDTTLGAVTVRLQNDTVVNAGFEVEIVRVAGSNNVTVDCTTNSCTINGVSSNTTISSSYAPKKYKLLETNTDDYLEV